MSFQVKSFDQLVADMVSWIVAHSPQITDLSPGSVIRSFCEASALSLEELYVSSYLGFRRYVDDIQETIFGFERKGGIVSSGEVTFSRSGSTGIDTIPIGTKVETPTGLVYVTTELATIADAATSSNVTGVDSEEVGVTYNVPLGSITVISDDIDIAGITVTNANATTGGVNIETDYQYKQRFQAYIEGLAGSNLAGLISGALSVDGITSASVQELFPPVANVNVNLYVDDGSSAGVSAAKVLEIQSIIDGDGSEDNPGYRAAGVNVVVIAPTVVTQNVSVTISLLAGVDISQMEIDVNLVLSTYMNNLGIGATIIYNELVASCMEVYGVTDVAITVPSGNVAILASQVGRLGTLTVAT